MSGKIDNEKQFLNNPLIPTLLFQLEISGKDTKDEQPSNKKPISLALDVSHFDISGKDVNERQPENIQLIFFIFEKLNLDISGKYNNDEHW